jgi:cytochrome c oxidase assembly factor CtaG
VIAILETLALLAAAGTIAAWYRMGARRARDVHQAAPSRSQAALFAAGLVVTILALGPSADRVADAIFWVHMVQHMVLIAVAAPLLVAGAPWLAFEQLGPHGLRRGQRRIYVASVRTKEATAWTAAIAFFVSATTLWGWHVPVVFEAGLRSNVIHGLEHLMLLASSGVFWWVVLAPVPRARLGEGWMVALIAMAGAQMSVLGALLTLSPAPWYPAYVSTEAARGLTPLVDQQIAGLIMWVPAGFIYLGLAAWRFTTWINADAGDEVPASMFTRASAGEGI